MTTVPPARYTRIRDPIYTYLFVLAVVAVLGVVGAVWFDLMAISWPDTFGICIWFAGLVAVTAAAIATRTQPVRP